jgi:hypothetical protein
VAIWVAVLVADDMAVGVTHQHATIVNDIGSVAHLTGIVAWSSKVIASYVRQVSANFALAFSRLAQNPCDGSRGAPTAPVIIHIHG